MGADYYEVPFFPNQQNLRKNQKKKKNFFLIHGLGTPWKRFPHLGFCSFLFLERVLTVHHDPLADGCRQEIPGSQGQRPHWNREEHPHQEGDHRQECSDRRECEGDLGFPQSTAFKSL